MLSDIILKIGLRPGFDEGLRSVLGLPEYVDARWSTPTPYLRLARTLRGLTDPDWIDLDHITSAVDTALWATPEWFGLSRSVGQRMGDNVSTSF